VAYVRAAGRAAGAPQAFGGPMAKPHRMAAVTLAALVAAGAPEAWRVPAWALGVVAVGGLLTAVLRLRSISHALRSAAR